MKKRNAEKITSKLLDEFIRIRQEKGLSHYKIAELTGLSRPEISLIESKQRIPTNPYMFKNRGGFRGIAGGFAQID